jgi:hypothetical protein
MHSRYFACSTLALLLAACSSGASLALPDPTGERLSGAHVPDVGPSDWVTPDHGQWTTPFCGDGCDANCVEESRFQVADGVVYNIPQDLFWERDPGPQLIFFDALDYCADLSLGGAVNAWRLPTSAELSSLLYKAGGLKAGFSGYCAPAIDQAAFPSTSLDYYWTAADGNARPTAINFFDGRGHALYSDTSATARCVHDPVRIP